MDRAVAENASTVIDGVAIVPGMIELDAYRDLADVIFLVVATLDIDAYAGRFASRAKGQSHRAAHRYLQNLDGIVRVQDYLLEAAERHAIPIVDNESFERAVVQIIRHVAETLRERRGLSIDEML
jgi:2-phosphoglycerate kinase